MTNTNFDIDSTAESLIEEGLRCFMLASLKLGTNLFDNYGYREYAALCSLKKHLPSAEKVIGRTGDDASAISDGYFHIEQKSGTVKSKKLTESAFPKMEFDKQSDPVRRQKLFGYDGFSISAFEFFGSSPVAMVFVPRDQIKKLHPLIQSKQQEKIRDFQIKTQASQNIGRDSIKISLKEVVEHVGEENLICWLRGDRIDSKEFFQKLRDRQIPCNQHFGFYKTPKNKSVKKNLKPKNKSIKQDLQSDDISELSSLQ